MKKTNATLVFGVLFLVIYFGYVILHPYMKMPNPSPEAIMKRENELAFINTTLWSGLIMIVISIYLRIKAKNN